MYMYSTHARRYTHLCKRVFPCKNLAHVAPCTIGYMAIFLPIYPVFFLSRSFVGPDMPYTRCVRVVSVLAGVCVLLNVHHAPQVPSASLPHLLHFTINNSKTRQFFICYLLMTRLDRKFYDHLLPYPFFRFFLH